MKGTKLPKHTLLTREEALRARDLIRERLGSDRHLKITAAALFSKADRDGEFTGYAATFDGEPDLAGDIIAHGAFAQSIRDWKARETWPPLLWQHDTSTPAASLGVILDMKEDRRGLLIAGRLDLDHEPSVAVWRAMRSGRITTFSFAYVILEEHKRDDGVNVLDVLDVLECSVTPNPANRNAQLVAVKSEPDPERATELEQLNKQLDALAQPGPLRNPVDPAEVEAFLLEEKQRYVEEALVRSEQAAWEGRMGVNMVLDPVPVRVDARMRPVTS
jgi:HK97 family phage prohead protease